MKYFVDTTYNGQGGFTLEAKLMKEFVLLNIDFSIDFYAQGQTFEQGVIKE